jgi:rubrerythrin
MDIQKIFAPLKRLEIGLSELYDLYSERLSSDQEAALVFKRLALDEKAHAALLDYQRNLVRNNPKEFGEVDLDLDQVEALARRIESLRANDCPDLGSAVRVALEFESSAAEYHYRNALKQSQPSLAKLLDCLGKSDRHHLEELREFARSRGYLTA